jgi:hypothetical protein
MNIVERIAERRIQEAIERGEFDNLPGAGKPLDLDDDANVPVELRVAYRILKNSGFVPPEVELRRDIANAEQLLTTALDAGERRAANQRLEFLLMKLAAMRGGARDARVEAAYYDRLAEKVRRDGRERTPAEDRS